MVLHSHPKKSTYWLIKLHDSRRTCPKIILLVKCHQSMVYFEQQILLLYRGYHQNDAIMGAIASQITSLTIVYSAVYSDADQRAHQSSASLAFVWGIHRWPLNSPHKGPVTRKMLPFDNVIMVMTPYIHHVCAMLLIISYSPRWIHGMDD